MEFKREKITDMERIKALYKEGKISRSTFWRARKRGYIILNYHSTQKLSDYVLSKQEMYILQVIIYKKVMIFINKHQRKFYDHSTFNELKEDIARDVFLWIIEKQPHNLKEAVYSIKYAIYNILGQHPMWYSKYLDIPFLRKGREETKMEYLGSLESSSYLATML